MLHNGDNYEVTFSGSNIIVRKGGPQALIYDIFTSPYRVCRTYNKVPGESLAVFGDKIFYAYTADTPGAPDDTSSCTNTGHGMSVWVAVFDIARQDTQPWVSNRAIGSVSIKYQTSSASGAAITVFDNQLYLFSDSGIWTSADGISWTGPQPAFMDSGWQPLDAITIYPPNGALYDGPRILIVYGLQTSSAYLYYSSLYGATWNGKFDTTKRYFAVGSPFALGTQQTFLGSVALLTGTASFNNWGAKEAAVQLFARAKVGSTNVIQHIEFTYGNSLGQWRVDPTTYGTGVSSSLVYVTARQECTVPSYWDLRQYITLTWWSSSGHHVTEVKSDALAPQNRDIAIINCGDPGGTETNMTEPDPADPEALAVRQRYWTLAGVVLGTPPFAQNGYSAFSDYQNFSNVNLGRDQSNAVEHTQSMSNSVMVSAGTEVHAGLENVAGVGVSIDMSYKHAWESSNGESVTKGLKYNSLMGTLQSSCREMGKWGWALFVAPRIVYQDWKAFAYDYNPDTGGPLTSALNQDLHTMKVLEVKDHPEASFIPKAVAFELANPGGPNDTYPGLMTGMAPFRSSLNTSFWHNPHYVWDANTYWEKKLGQGELPQLEFVSGYGNEESLTKATQSYSSSGATDDVSITEGVSFTAGSKVNGMSGYVKVGYTGSFKWNTKATTSFGEQVTFTLRMKSCNYPGPNCVSSLVVQPYWLLATDERAPWIPTAFRHQKPWAITWKVWDITPAEGMVIDAPTCPAQACTTSADCTVPPQTFCSNPTGGVNLGACVVPPATSLSAASLSTASLSAALPGGRAGTALPPLRASGRVVSGMGGGQGGGPDTHYTLEGGRLSWVLKGVEERIPLTADAFDPAKGVTVQLQDLSWPLTSATGTWSRSGHIWNFQPMAAGSRMSMKLDFAKATYDLQLQKADLSGRVPAGTRIVRLLVTVNDIYLFYSELRHDVDIAWRWKQPAADARTLHVTSFEGRYNSATQHGNASIAGTLPAVLPTFGDVEINVNEHPYAAQLVAREDFQKALQSGSVFRFAKQGLNLVFDFGNKTWSATFNEAAFRELLAPRVGTLRTKFTVGGVPWYQSDLAVLDYSANLALRQ